MRFSIVLLVLLLSPALTAEEIRFATPEQGRALLAAEDDFTKRLSKFDLLVRMSTEKVPSIPEFLEFVGRSVIAWPDAERAALKESWSKVEKRLAELQIEIPKGITMIRTNGKEEVGSAYTRGKNIIFHPGSVAAGAELDGLLAHELFHILSRANSRMRDRMYAIIGFAPCGEIAFPTTLASLKITNPDAPVNQHAIQLEIKGEPRKALPVLLARAPYDPERGGDLFAYLQMQFLIIEEQTRNTWIAAENKDGSPAIVSMLQVKNFHEQIGANTGYIIHPEEILADNFKHLILKTKQLKNPEIVEKMAKAFVAPL